MNTDILKDIRAAFDGDSVAAKNVMLRKAYDAISAAADGVLVPKEPTPKMHHAAWLACDTGMKKGKDWQAFNAKIWAAMLAAAPAQEKS